MKKWEKICLVIAIICLIITAFIVVQRNTSRDCVFCDMIPHHAPCLIDLETGEWIELDIYLPHETLAGELADSQPYTSYFSFISIGDLVGYKTTDPPIIEIDIPAGEIVSTPRLCKNCSQLLEQKHRDRYILADTYAVDAIELYPIESGSAFSFRCYDIAIEEKTETNEITVTVCGTLDIKNNEK